MTRVPAVIALSLFAGTVVAQEPALPFASPPPRTGEQRFPINLATALQLAQVRALDVQLASSRTAASVAAYDRAKYLWLPTLYLGSDYFRHDGRIQDIRGNVFDTDKGAVMGGAGAGMVFAVTDAVYAPLAARQEVRARQADRQAAANDTTLAVAEAFFNVQQARGDLAGMLDAVTQAEELVRRAEALAPGLAPPVEATRARAELSRRRQAAASARERWKTASSELARLLRLDPTLMLEPIEPPFLAVGLIDRKSQLDALIPVALTNRPELASRQALVQATLQRLKQERIRPLVPSVLMRSVSTNPSGTLGAGYFGGGVNGSMANFGARGDVDLQLVWEIQNLGLGNKARVAERRAEHEQAMIELFRIQDRIAAEVAQAHAQLESAGERLREAEAGYKEAVDSMEKNVAGLNQTRRIGEVLVLVVRPQEAVAALQALAQAALDFYGAVADYNRAQFRLYRALGHPAEALPR
jgi:outer membrane protein TolC